MTKIPRLLIGPLHNPVVLGTYAKHPDIKLFMAESESSQQYAYDIVYPLEKVRHFNQILDYLPDSWEPDLVLLWDPAYQVIPPGIEECPYPTALIPGDWNLAFGNTLQTARSVDAVFADGRLGPILRRDGLRAVYLWSAFAFDDQSIYRDPTHERNIDVCFIGYLDPGIHPERGRYLKQLLDLQDRYHISVRYGVWGEAYRRALNQSRIVFNYTICQVLNIRAYEAPACGALLFIEASNCEARQIFEDGVSCVFYNEENLIDRLCYYLEHEDERAAIAEAGYQAIQDHSYEKHFKQLLDLIPEMLKHRPQQRLVLVQTPQQRRLHAINQIASSGFVHAHHASVYLQELWQELAASIQEERIWEFNALLVMLFPHIDKHQGLHSVFDVPLEKLRQGFKKILQLAPDNPIISYHFAFCCEYLGHNTQALSAYYYTLESFDRLVEEPVQPWAAYQNFILPFNTSGRGTDQLAFEWERVSYESIEQGFAVEPQYRKLITSAIWEHIARIYIRQNSYEEAWRAFESAYRYFPRAVLLLEMCCLVHPLQRPEKFIPLFKETLALQPMFAEHLAELVSPHILLKHAAQIQSWSKLYLSLFKNLEQPYFLCSLILAAEGKQQLPSKQEFLSLTLTPSLYQGLCFVLQQFETSAILQPLQVLRQPLGLNWNMSGEPPPALEMDLGLYASPEGLLFGSGPDADYQRVYDQPTALAQGHCGPDKFPFLFPRHISEPDTSQLDDLLPSETRLIVIVLEGWTPTTLREALKGFASSCQAQSDTLLLAWCPPGCEFSLSQLEESLPTDMLIELAWLDEALSLLLQAQLLQRSVGVVTLPLGRGLYYSYWAAQLKTPVCWAQAPSWLPETDTGSLMLPVRPLERVLQAIHEQQLEAPPELPRHWIEPELIQQSWRNAIWCLRVWPLLDQLKVPL